MEFIVLSQTFFSCRLQVATSTMSHIESAERTDGGSMSLFILSPE